MKGEEDITAVDGDSPAALNEKKEILVDEVGDHNDAPYVAAESSNVEDKESFIALGL